MSHPALDVVRAALADLPQDVPEIRPSLSPVIPPKARAGWFPMRTSVAPHNANWGNGFRSTIQVQLISPAQGFDAASDELAEVADLVIALLAKADTLVVNSGEFGAYNDTLLSYTITCETLTTSTLSEE